MPDSVQSGSDGQTELREADERFMEQALALAATGRGRTHPNPMVGAVLVVAGDVVGKGAHLAAGTAHAEVVALREAGARARGATLYCTLEPCSHYGRTPPCADALIAAGVHRVVVAMRDPNPQVDGRGLRRLMDAGVEVEVMSGPLARRAAELNAAFVKSMRTGLPLVDRKSVV